MKAEQRKELETNALADRMGHLMQRMKTQPRRATLYWVLGGLILVIALAVVWRIYDQSRTRNSEYWRFVDIGSQNSLLALVKEEPETNPGKAASFQIAWLLYWDMGVKRLGVGDGGHSGLQALDEAAMRYQALAKECAGDKLWEPEALYGLAVIEETRAVVKLDALERAKERYEELKTKYPESARGKLAADWLAKAEKREQYDELKAFYQELHTSLNIIDLNALKVPQNKNLLPPKKDNPPPKK